MLRDLRTARRWGRWISFVTNDARVFPWCVWSTYPFGMHDLSKNVNEINK